jgi:hypothetical protein
MTDEPQTGESRGKGGDLVRRAIARSVVDDDHFPLQPADVGGEYALDDGLDRGGFVVAGDDDLQSRRGLRIHPLLAPVLVVRSVSETQEAPLTLTL